LENYELMMSRDNLSSAELSRDFSPPLLHVLGEIIPEHQRGSAPMTEVEGKEIPCPALCGATFSPTGKLFVFSNFSGLAEKLPRTLTDLRRLVSRSLDSSKEKQKRGDQKMSSSPQRSTTNASLVCSQVAIFEFGVHSEIDVILAQKYM
jgi:hypothetical protein